MTVQPRTDAENRRLLEQMVPAYDRLKTDRIRSEGDVERAQRELAEAQAAAREELQTDDEEEIKRMLEEARAHNSEAVDIFTSAIKTVQEGLQRLGSGT